MSTIPRKRTTKSLKRIDFGCAGMLMTPAEFDAIEDYDPNYCYELIRGVLVVSPIASEAEADPNEELGFILRLYQRTHPDGRILDKTLHERYVFLEDSRRRADRVIWTGLGRVPRPKKDVPSIVVEFVSKSKRDWLRDYAEKRVEYLNAGVREYWVINRFDRTLTVFRKLQGQWEERVFDAATIYQTPLLPGFELSLAEILEVADSWKTSK